MLTLSAELRYPLLADQIFLGVFTDMGNCWGSVGSINLSELYQGVGFGLRIAIPMLGIMGFDFSWPLVAPPTTAGVFSDPLKAYHIPLAPKIDFSIGKGF